MNKVVDFFLHYQNQFKMLHWQTKSYARHQAFGSFYDSLSDAMDEFIEVHMGKYGRVETDGSIPIHNLNKVNVNDVIENFEMFLISLTNHYDVERDSDLLNIRDGILGDLNKLKYLLTLD